MRDTTIVVRAVWDPEAKVFVATSDDVPGLATEAADPQEMNRKLQVMIPELFETNGLLSDDTPAEVPMVVLYEHLTKIRLDGAAV